MLSKFYPILKCIGTPTYGTPVDMIYDEVIVPYIRKMQV